MTAASERRCRKLGYLVDAATPLPDDPAVYARDGGPLVGCNRLRCASCGAEVRSWSGYRLADPPWSGAEHAEVHATVDPATSRYFTRDHAGHCFRVYACACFTTEIANAVDLERGFIEHDGWSCAGHPPPSSPGAPAAP